MGPKGARPKANRIQEELEDEDQANAPRGHYARGDATLFVPHMPAHAEYQTLSITDSAMHMRAQCKWDDYNSMIRW